MSEKRKEKTELQVKIADFVWSWKQRKSYCIVSELRLEEVSRVEQA
jgi:hypothetical protein